MVHTAPVHGIPRGSVLAFINVAGGAKVDAARLALPVPLLLPSGIRIFRPQRFAHALQRRQAALMCVCKWKTTGHVCMSLPAYMPCGQRLGWISGHISKPPQQPAADIHRPTVFRTIWPK